jgi:hypothetical protein
MKIPVRLLTSLVVAAFIGAAPVCVFAAEKHKAQDAKAAPQAEKGKPTIKEIFQNDHVRVFEVTFKPGDAADSVARLQRIIRPIKGGTLTRIYPDGKKEKTILKTGEVQVFEASPAYSPKNEGKTDIVLYNVYLKQPK